MNFRPIQDFPKDFASTWAQAQQAQLLKMSACEAKHN